MKQSEAMKLVLAIRGFYPGKPIADETEDAFARGLGDVDYDLANMALDEWSKTEAWPPSVADIRAGAARQIVDMPHPDDAWTMLVEYVTKRRTGRASSLPGAVRQAADVAGGVFKVTNDPKGHIPFARAYRAECKRIVSAPITRADTNRPLPAPDGDAFASPRLNAQVDAAFHDVKSRPKLKVVDDE